MVARKTAMVAPRLFERREPSDQAATPIDTTPGPTARPRKKNVRPLHTLTSMSEWERAFSTRKRTLMSKAYELEVATGATVTITVHAPTGEIHYYANDDVHVERLKNAQLVSDDAKRYTKHYFADQITNQSCRRSKALTIANYQNDFFVQRISTIQHLFQSRNLVPESDQSAAALPTTSTSTPQSTRSSTVPSLLPTATDKLSPECTAMSADDPTQASPQTNGNLNKRPSPYSVSETASVNNANTVSPRVSVHPRNNSKSSAERSQTSETKGRQTVSPRAEKVPRGEADISPGPLAKHDRFPGAASARRPSPASAPKSPKINVTVVSPVAQVQGITVKESTDSDSTESSETSSEDSDSSSSEEEDDAAPSDFIPLSQLSPVSKAKSYVSPFLSPTVARANVVPLPFSPGAESVVDLTEPEHLQVVENMLQLPPDITRKNAVSTEENPYSFNHLLSPAKTPSANRSSSLGSDVQCKKKVVKSKTTGSQSTSVASPLGSDDQCKKKAVKSKTTGSQSTSVASPLGSDDQCKKKAVKSKTTGSRSTSVGSSLGSDDQCKKKAVKSKTTGSRSTSVGSSLGSDDQCKKKTVKSKTTGSRSTSVASPLGSDDQCKKKAVKSKKPGSRVTSVDSSLDSDDQCKKKAVKSKTTGSRSTSVKSKLKSSIDPRNAANVELPIKTTPRDRKVKTTPKRKRPNSASNATTSQEKVPKKQIKSDSGLSDGPTKRTKRTEEKTRDDDQKQAASLLKSDVLKKGSLAENAKRSTPIKQPFGKTNQEQTLYDSRKRPRFNEDRSPSPEVCDNFAATGERNARRPPVLYRDRTARTSGRGVGAQAFHEHRRENVPPEPAYRPTCNGFYEHRRENVPPEPADRPTHHVFYEHRRENVPPEPADRPTREELCQQVRDFFDEKLSDRFLAQNEQLHRYVSNLESKRIPLCPPTMIQQMTAFRALDHDLWRHAGHFTKNEYKTLLRDALFQSSVVDVVKNVLIKRKACRSKPIRSHVKWISNS